MKKRKGKREKCKVSRFIIVYTHKPDLYQFIWSLLDAAYVNDFAKHDKHYRKISTQNKRLRYFDPLFLLHFVEISFFYSKIISNLM